MFNDIKIIYEDNDVLVIDKPAGLVVFAESSKVLGSEASQTSPLTLMEALLEKHPNLGDVGHPPRYGIVHRLDKDTSGVLLVAKNNEALIFLQEQFKNRKVGKKYLALAVGTIKEDKGRIETLIGRSPMDPRKQKAYGAETENNGPKLIRKAVTEYKVLKRFNGYTLLEVAPRTGRKHQIRCHMAYIHHPLAGDKIYGFKDSPKLIDLTRQFLHASSLRITLPNGEIKEFKLNLSEDLKKVLNNLQK